MKEYGVKELAKLSGVSVRTLHYYDNIGLLKPAKRTEAGYRYYGQSELLRLQQILFYKELDLPLKEISELLDEPGFDLIHALENHKRALHARKSRITQLLQTIDLTIQQLKENDTITHPEMLYEGLPREVGTTYREEARKKYGKASVEQAEKELMSLGKAGFERLQRESERISGELYHLRNENPTGLRVQVLIAQHYEIIRQFWGTSQLADKQAEAYAGLGQLYLDDPRFTVIDGKPQLEYARFMQKAMGYFADTQLK